MPSDLFVFGPFELDAGARRLTRNGEAIALSSRQFDLLHLLVAHAGQVLSKDALIEAAWAGVAVTDNSVEQAISTLRRALAAPDTTAYIETQARRGYRFAAEVRRVERREPELALEALLAPHRAWVEGRAALETLERAQITRAREVFERVLEQVPDQASAHVGLANAGVMQFEMTRSELAPDTAALSMAAAHAREACRLDARYGEAWATLGFVLARTGHQADALAASRRAVALEPDNWRHHLRLGYVSWGEERLREARRTLQLLPGFALAHWLAATVHVARQAFDDAERELLTGLDAQASPAHSRFSGVALHWLLGLLMLARGEDAGALHHFDLELAAESAGQLYARECCANTWYAIGAVRIRTGDRAGAADAFGETLRRVPLHPLARVGLGLVGDAARTAAFTSAPDIPASVLASPEVAFARAAVSALSGDVAGAASLADAALAAAPEGSALWTLPVDPLVRATTDERWSAPLARLRNRAA
ncbi:MAG TPA: winged helix-turn-helix domain-containing protein [Vicinamibacterales bacterium]|nr:winged helix-turn-helix domain-containing protein [Vicinamibacterales bacterium]